MQKPTEYNPVHRRISVFIIFVIYVRKQSMHGIIYSLLLCYDWPQIVTIVLFLFTLKSILCLSHLIVLVLSQSNSASDSNIDLRPYVDKFSRVQIIANELKIR